MAENIDDGAAVFGHLDYTLTIADLTAAATTQAVTLAGFPADAFPLEVQVSVNEFFTGGAITAVTLQIGDAGDPNGLMAALNVFAVTGTDDFSVGTDGVEAEYGSTGPARESAYAPEALFTSTTDDVDAATAGRVHIRLYYKQRLPPEVA